MGITKLFSRGAWGVARADSPRRRERRRSTSRFSLTPLEAFEDRVLLSPAPVIGLAGTLTGGSSTTNLAPTVGITATTPTLVGGQIVLGFTNTSSSPVTVGVAVYQDQTDPPHVPLSTEVLLAVQYYTVSAHSSLTVDVGNMCSVEVDSFINTAVVSTNGQTPTTTTVSNVVPSLPAASDFPSPTAGPPFDAGYNYNINTGAKNTLPTSPNQSPPAGLRGTLLSFAQTTDVCTPSAPLTQGFWKNHTDEWPALPTFTSGGTTVSGLNLGNTFYTADQLETILETPPQGGNAVLILAHQEIAAKLNLISDEVTTSPALLSAAIDALRDADTALGDLNALTDFVKSSSTLGQQLVNDSNILDDFNSSGT